MKYLFSIFVFSKILVSISLAQQPIITKIEPPNWWSNHSYNNIQLMIYGSYLDSINVTVDCENIKIQNVTYPYNNNYAFVDISIDKNAEPAEYEFTFSNSNGQAKYKYLLMERDKSENIHQGFSSEDVIYLIFPDRFINGDTLNDYLFNEKDEFEFGSLNGRHGGDIQGMINSLDYLQELGITAIWSTPVLENNMYMSYHGYAATDLYKVDPRQGTNDLYKKFVNETHKRGLKVIYDHVANHIGINHPWSTNPPTETWFNGKPGNHLEANHDKVGIVDIHSSSKTVKNSTEGWFTNYMPDLNQSDPFMAKYIIQNTIWWIEYSGIDGIREDTYPYSNQKYMSEWAKIILEHYPNFNIVGEVWKGLPSVLAAYQTKTFFPRNFDTNLPIVTDFAFRDALFEYLSGTSDLNNIYETLAQDFLYSNPNNLLVFFDNHDIDRGMYGAKWDMHKFKAALMLVLTTRGIPQLFYGTEFGLDGGGHHGRIREMFPLDYLTAEETEISNEKKLKQKDIYNFTQNLLKLRNDYEVIRKGKLTHFPPKDNYYIYTKEFRNKVVLFCLNDNEKAISIKLSNYVTNDKINSTIKNLLTGDAVIIEQDKQFTVPSKSISIYLIERE
jgi:glycosidase